MGAVRRNSSRGPERGIDGGRGLLDADLRHQVCFGAKVRPLQLMFNRGVVRAQTFGGFFCYPLGFFCCWAIASGAVCLTWQLQVFLRDYASVWCPPPAALRVMHRLD